MQHVTQGGVAQDVLHLVAGNHPVDGGTGGLCQYVCRLQRSQCVPVPAQPCFNCCTPATPDQCYPPLPTPQPTHLRAAASASTPGSHARTRCRYRPNNRRPLPCAQYALCCTAVPHATLPGGLATHAGHHHQGVPELTLSLIPDTTDPNCLPFLTPITPRSQLVSAVQVPASHLLIPLGL